LRRPFAPLFTLAALALALFACATDPGIRAASYLPRRSAAGFVFLVPGIWPDRAGTGGFWISEQARALRAVGVEPLPVEHRTFLWGVALGYGTKRPAEKIAAFARALEVRHRETGCPVPPRLHGIGYSAGTIVLLEAIARGASLDRLYFGGSPIFAWSGRIEAAIAARRLGTLVNYCSIFDGAASATLGCGAFGFRGDGGGRAENRPHLRTHLEPVFCDGEVARAVAGEIAAAGRGERPHVCFDDPRFLRWFIAARERLLDEDAPPEPPPAPSFWREASGPRSDVAP
jgi:hypothetical protein